MKSIVKNLVVILLAIILIAIFIYAYIKNKKVDFSNNPIEYTQSTNMKIESRVFENSIIPIQYTCDGESLGIPLIISNVPKGTQSLALIVDDPDAPSGDYVHWLVWNISPNTTDIATGVKPDGAVEGKNSSGKTDWVAPCPPSGDHHYNFKIYALDTALSIDESSDKIELLEVMNNHILDEANLIGTYGR